MPKRNDDLAKIHIAKKALALDDHTYRSLISRVTKGKKTSAGKLDYQERSMVLEEFKRLGWKPKRPRRAGKVPHNLNKEAQLTKIEAQLSEMSLPWAYADSIAKHMFNIERVAWLRQQEHRDAIIAALHVEQEKLNGLNRIDKQLKKMGKERSYLSKFELRKGWDRHRPTLKALYKTLLEESM